MKKPIAVATIISLVAIFVISNHVPSQAQEATGKPVGRYAVHPMSNSAGAFVLDTHTADVWFSTRTSVNGKNIKPDVWLVPKPLNAVLASRDEGDDTPAAQGPGLYRMAVLPDSTGIYVVNTQSGELYWLAHIGTGGKANALGAPPR